MIIAHVFIGIILVIMLINLAFTRNFILGFSIKYPFIKNFSNNFLLLLTVAFGSILPDLDIPFIKIIGWDIEHRQLLTHSAMPYISLIVIMTCLLLWMHFLDIKFKYTNIFAVIKLSIMLFASALLHVCTDILTAPSLLFAPVYTKAVYYPLFPFEQYPNWFVGYVNSPNLILELLPLVVTALILPRILKNGKELMYMLFFLGILLTSILLTLIPFI